MYRVIALGLPALLAMSLLAGCSDNKKKYPVTGKVVYKGDGEPVPAGLVIWLESTTKPYQRSWAIIEKDGKFVASTELEGAGSIQGEHRVRFSPGMNTIGIAEDLLGKSMPKRYIEYGTADLKVTIKPQQNDLVIEVDRPEKPANGGEINP